MNELQLPAGFGPDGQNRRKRKISEEIAGSLVAYIVDNDLAEGTRLPPEKQMAELFGVGRATLREALRLLESRGAIIIKSGPSGGPFVRRPQPRDFGDSLSLIMQYQRASLAEVIAARKTLEPVLAGLASRRLPSDQMKQLETTVIAMRTNPNSRAVFQAENARFHSTIAALSGNPVLGLFVESLIAMADELQVGIAYSEQRALAVIKAHEGIIAALESGPTDAESAMRRHLEEAEDYWKRDFSDLLYRPVQWLSS